VVVAAAHLVVAMVETVVLAELALRSSGIQQMLV
jgi:hypothetical protein